MTPPCDTVQTRRITLLIPPRISLWPLCDLQRPFHLSALPPISQQGGRCPSTPPALSPPEPSWAQPIPSPIAESLAREAVVSQVDSAQSVLHPCPISDSRPVFDPGQGVYAWDFSQDCWVIEGWRCELEKWDARHSVRFLCIRFPLSTNKIKRNHRTPMENPFAGLIAPFLA